MIMQGKSLKGLGGQVCQICGDGVGKAIDGEPFIACDVCAFPVCRPCYEYERKDGNQSCPQCKTRYKRHKGRLNMINIVPYLLIRYKGITRFNYLRCLFDILCIVRSWCMMVISL